MDSVPFDIGTLSSSALLGLAILFILTGLLVPRRILKDKIEEANRWRRAYEHEQNARAISDAQTRELLEVAKTTHAIIAAMAATSEHIRQSGDSDASVGP